MTYGHPTPIVAMSFPVLRSNGFFLSGYPPVKTDFMGLNMGRISALFLREERVRTMFTDNIHFKPCKTNEVWLTRSPCYQENACTCHAEQERTAKG